MNGIWLNLPLSDRFALLCLKELLKALLTENVLHVYSHGRVTSKPDVRE